MLSKKSIAGPIVGALAFIVGACGDDDADSDTTEAAAEQDATGAAEPTAVILTDRANDSEETDL